MNLEDQFPASEQHEVTGKDAFPPDPNFQTKMATVEQVEQVEPVATQPLVFAEQFAPDQWPDIAGNEFLLNLGDKWVYAPSAETPGYGLDKPVKWSEDKRRFDLSYVASLAEYWRNQGKNAYPAHFGTGTIAWLDFDDRPSDPDADYGKGYTLESVQARYDELLARYSPLTYCEQSRTRGRYHVAFRLPDNHGLPMRSIKIFHGIDLLIGDGWIRITGNSNGKPIADIPEELLKYLQHHASQHNFEGVPVSAVEGDPDLCAMPLEEAIMETRRRMVVSTSTTQGFTYKELIEGPCGLDESNISEARAALIQWAAKITCGHNEQHEIVWRIVSESYLADMTPTISKSNKGRFTHPSKINYDRFNVKGEYHKLIGKANAEVERDRAMALAQIREMEVVHIARAGKCIHVDDDYPRVELPDFPVPLYRRYRDWLMTSVAETDTKLANVATLSHMSAMLGSNVVGPSGTFANLYIVATAMAGFGKEVMAGGAMIQIVGNRVKLMGEPRSDGGMYRRLAEGPCVGQGFFLQDELGPWFEAVTKSPSSWQRSILDLLKKAYGVSQIGPRKLLTGHDLAKADPDRPIIKNPALSFLGMGTEDETFQGLAAHGITDGLLGRVFFAEGDGEPVFMEMPVQDVEPELLAQLKARFKTIDPLPGMPQPTVHVAFETEELGKEYFAWRKEISLWRRANPGKKAQLLRSLCENAIRIATAMAFWNGTPITREIYDWARIASENSVAMALEHLRKGNLDVDTIALAARIEKLIDRYFGEGKCTNPARAKPAMEKGYFTVAYLPDYDSITTRAAKIDSKDPKRAIMAALALLHLSNKITPVVNEKGYQIDGRWARGDAYD